MAGIFKERLKKIGAVFLGVSICMSSLGGGFIYASTDTPKDKDDKAVDPLDKTKQGGGAESSADDQAGNSATDDLSFYKIASAAAAYYSSSQAPGGDGVNPDWTTVRSASNVLGFIDAELTKGLVNWLWAKATNSSGTRSYTSFEAGKVKTSGSEKSGVGLISYAYYGAALTGLGLDSQISQGSFSTFTRFIFGGLMNIMYLLASSVDKFFGVVIYVLQNLNPFRFFAEAVGDNMGTKGVSGASSLNGLSHFISQLYRDLTSLSWAVVIPIFLAVLLANLFLFKITASPSDKLGMIKKYVVRIVFIAAGVPLLGTLYTGTLNQMESVTSNGGLAADKVILSTFVDFGSWASRHRLMIPSGARIEWNANAGRPSIMSQVKGRQNAIAINKLTYNQAGDISDSLDGKSIVDWDTDVLKTSGSGEALQVKSILDRFSSSDFYESSSWETYVKAGLKSGITAKKGKNKDKDADKKKEEEKKEFLEPTDPKNYEGDDAKVNPLKHRLFRTNGGRIYYDGTKFIAEGSQGVGNNLDKPVPLSAIGMYNYLNSEFRDESLISYSSEKASSNFIKASHPSVNLVGTGFSSVLYYLNGFVLLMVFAVLGFAYVLFIMFGSFKRSVLLIVNVPTAVLGAYKSIIKVIIYALALIVELIGTLFIYYIVQNFFISLPAIVEAPFVKALNAMSTISYGRMDMVNMGLAQSGALLTIMLIVSIVINIYFLKVALSLRGTLIKGIDEWLKGVVESLLGQQVEADFGDGKDKVPGGGAAKKLAKGAAVGAGLGLMSKGISGGFEKDGDNANGIRRVGSDSDDDEDDNDKLDSDDRDSVDTDHDGNSDKGAIGSGEKSDIKDKGTGNKIAKQNMSDKERANKTQKAGSLREASEVDTEIDEENRAKNIQSDKDSNISRAEHDRRNKNSKKSKNKNGSQNAFVGEYGSEGDYGNQGEYGNADYGVEGSNGYKKSVKQDQDNRVEMSNEQSSAQSSNKSLSKKSSKKKMSRVQKAKQIVAENPDLAKRAAMVGAGGLLVAKATDGNTAIKAGVGMYNATSMAKNAVRADTSKSVRESTNDMSENVMNGNDNQVASSTLTSGQKMSSQRSNKSVQAANAVGKQVSNMASKSSVKATGKSIANVSSNQVAGSSQSVAKGSAKGSIKSVSASAVGQSNTQSSSQFNGVKGSTRNIPTSIGNAINDMASNKTSVEMAKTGAKVGMAVAAGSMMLGGSKSSVGSAVGSTIGSAVGQTNQSALAGGGGFGASKFMQHKNMQNQINNTGSGNIVGGKSTMGTKPVQNNNIAMNSPINQGTITRGSGNNISRSNKSGGSGGSYMPSGSMNYGINQGGSSGSIISNTNVNTGGLGMNNSGSISKNMSVNNANMPNKMSQTSRNIQKAKSNQMASGYSMKQRQKQTSYSQGHQQAFAKASSMSKENFNNAQEVSAKYFNEGKDLEQKYFETNKANKKSLKDQSNRRNKANKLNKKRSK